ncbi:MAG: DoxX family protein [Pseudonocardiaceae bacterium]
MIGNLEAPGTSRGLNITLWTLQGVLALVFVLSALMKFAAAPQAVQVFEAIGAASWLPYVIGGLEIIGAVALLIPRLAGLAAAAFVALMIGAVLTHLIWGGPVVLEIVLLILAAVLAYGRRGSTVALLTDAGAR